MLDEIGIEKPTCVKVDPAVGVTVIEKNTSTRSPVLLYSEVLPLELATLATLVVVGVYVPTTKLLIAPPLLILMLGAESAPVTAHVLLSVVAPVIASVLPPMIAPSVLIAPALLIVVPVEP